MLTVFFFARSPEAPRTTITVESRSSAVAGESLSGAMMLEVMTENGRVDSGAGGVGRRGCGEKSQLLGSKKGKGKLREQERQSFQAALAGGSVELNNGRRSLVEFGRRTELQEVVVG